MSHRRRRAEPVQLFFDSHPNLECTRSRRLDSKNSEKCHPLTEFSIGKRIGADQSFVSRFERGERRLDLIELQAICKACGIELSEFVSEFENTRN